MPRPVVSDIAEELYASLGPWARADTVIGEQTDEWRLLELCESIGRTIQPVEDITADSDTHVGWGKVLDPDVAPEDWLPWLAQFGGVRVKEGLALPEQRARIKALAGMRRGTPSAIVGAAQQYLTDSKTVFLIERHGSAWRLTVATLADETPDPGAVERAVREQKPAGIVLTVQTVEGGDFDSLRDTHASFDEVTDLYADFNEVLADPTKRP